MQSSVPADVKSKDTEQEPETDKAETTPHEETEEKPAIVGKVRSRHLYKQDPILNLLLLPKYRDCLPLFGHKTPDASTGISSARLKVSCKFSVNQHYSSSN